MNIQELQAFALEVSNKTHIVCIMYGDCNKCPFCSNSFIEMQDKTIHNCIALAFTDSLKILSKEV